MTTVNFLLSLALWIALVYALGVTAAYRDIKRRFAELQTIHSAMLRQRWIEINKKFPLGFDVEETRRGLARIQNEPFEDAQ